MSDYGFDCSELAPIRQESCGSGKRSRGRDTRRSAASGATGSSTGPPFGILDICPVPRGTGPSQALYRPHTPDRVQAGRSLPVCKSSNAFSPRGFRSECADIRRPAARRTAESLASMRRRESRNISDMANPLHHPCVAVTRNRRTRRLIGSRDRQSSSGNLVDEPKEGRAWRVWDRSR